MITFDGDRSKRRKWFANKQIGTIKSLGIPSKTLYWDGFGFYSWQQGDLSGGRVSSPAGLMVMCSTTAGIKVAMLDYWAGAVTSFTDVYALGYSPPSSEKPQSYHFEFPDEDALLALGIDTFLYTPFQYMSEFDLGDTYTEAIYNVQNSETQYPDLSCAPGLHPHQSAEALWLTLTDRADYPDENPASGFEYSKFLLEHSLLYYMSDNSNVSGRFGFVSHEDWHWSIWTPSLYHPAVPKYYSVPQRVDNNNVYQIRNSVSYPSNYGYNEMIVAWNMYNPEETLSPLNYSTVTLEDLIPAGGDLPDSLRSLYIYRNSTGDATFTSSPAGTYFFKLDGVDYTLHAVSGLPADSDSGDAGEDLGNYFRDNPGDSKWNLFYILKIDDTSYLVNSDQFLSILDSHSTFDLVTDTTQSSPDYDFFSQGWTKAAEVLRYILMVPPINYNAHFPYDSYIFYTHRGTVCAWSRRLGVFEFTTTGILTANDITFDLPSEVTSTDGVQPKISYSGTYDGDPYYLCICEQIGEEVKAVYWGSPFGAGWTKIPDLTEGTLLTVRPIKVSPDLIQLIGIAKIIVGTEDEAYYPVSFYNDAWKRLGKLPFEVQDKSVFSLCLFGNDQAVKDLMEYPTPLSATPQIPLGPYNLYTSEL